jgi:methyl-accepting chemotaxis protein
MSLISMDAGKKADKNAEKATLSEIVMLSAMLIVILASVLLGVYISGIIGGPLVTMTKLANLLASGDVDTDKVLTDRDMKLKGRKDEIGKLSTAFHKLIVFTKKQVGTAQLVAAGDLTANVEIRSEYDVLGKALSELVGGLNRMIISIVSAADQVSAGAASLSSSSLDLSQGAAEQASGVEQLTASIDQIATQTMLNAQNAETANKLAVSAKNNADRGNAHMKDMLKAMDEINVSSNNINKIIKVIDDIAFQTNILALNAAVEAARAGQHGLGFAVVAEEVRTLAAKSASAASETTEMIENSIQKVKIGSMIANDTAKALASIVEEVDKAAKLVGDIAAASKEQAAAIGQINKGIAQVSQVVQANAATSEESAAASEELSGQAAQLKEIVSFFRIKSDAGAEA